MALPPLVAAKLALYQAMKDDGVTQVELARRTKRDQKDVRRLLDLDHRSHIELVEDALAKLGRRLIVSVEKEAATKATAKKKISAKKAAAKKKATAKKKTATRGRYAGKGAARKAA